MANKEVVIVGAARTAIGKFMGTLKDVPARELAITAAKAAIERSGVPADQIDEICMGQLYGGMQGSLPARQVSMRVGLPHRSSAVCVNQNCTSGMRALEIACHNIMLGQTEIGLVVGVESMTNAPYLLPKARMGYRMGQGNIEDSMIHDGLFDELVPGHMAMTAENVAVKYGITRQECDELALISHSRCTKSTKEGVFKREIVPVEMKSKKGSTFFEADENFIPDASMEKISKLPTAFKKDGVVTAANASSINDGASAVVIMSSDKAKALGLKPLLKLVSICNAGIDPVVMGLGPAVAIPKALKQAGMKFEDIDYWEVNEAFAAQWLGVGRMLKQDHGMNLTTDNCNFNGSGIALGHPVGSTGLRIIVSLYYELERQGKTTGGASLCVGTGPAMASLWTRNI
ncbi:MAG: thiolase family protein [Candidatus Competibacteraceae bacterium]|nr:thiolase family protein [Candidatus Competibacteraceae bacterium]MBK7982948.1 thiolase family protein [Candidatus Competibacteraceae bacterium]MBK8898500.1 thiolase family protein [Candidatus Competibacteraceae bacterium]MBK8962309.1 thiolase family protein [Candidatus Competibacteraceae bacterium]MBK9951528.1 thiolase family protein [Candidatus Competibacteraceae bacterium]